jgi:hypothetical protein
MTAEEKAIELYHKPYPDKSDDYIPNMFAMQSRKDFISGANWQASQHEWVKCSDRLPTEADAVDGRFELAMWSSEESTWEVYFCKLKELPLLISEDEHGLYWRTPLPNNFPEPPKTEI